jgi:molecular chaperone DnaK
MGLPPLRAIGIDLGTTNSVVSYIDEFGRPQTLLNSEGEKLTPSAVLFENEEVIVGREALKAISLHSDAVAMMAKRDFGERTFHRVIHGRMFPPEAIQAFVLNKLRVDAQQQIGHFSKVVITVPAYFDESRRKATQDSGYMAGFEVLDIINEPTAAALAYGFQQGMLDASGQVTEPKRILVYDLGGGTFDVTVMELAGNDFRALSTDGDVHLGGHDWDQRLVDQCAEEFRRKFGLDVRRDEAVSGKLWRECEEAKRTLTVRKSAVIPLEYRGKSLKMEVTREQFEDWTRDLLDRTAFTTREALRAANFEWKDLDRILLVGGSTRMPAVFEMLKQLSGREPDRSISQDEAVAHGAALHAELLLKRHQGEAPRFRVRNVNSHSLGVVGTETRTREARNVTIIPKNTPLPAEATRVFKTQRHGQQSLVLQVVEGESPVPEECSQVGRCVCRELPLDLPTHTPVEVKFRYEENGRLGIVVSMSDGKIVLNHDMSRDNTLTQDQLDSWRDYISGQPALIDD